MTLAELDYSRQITQLLNELNTLQHGRGTSITDIYPRLQTDIEQSDGQAVISAKFITFNDIEVK